MGTAIALTSLKGGVGKTTIAENLGIVLGRMGRRILVVDCDIATAGLSNIIGLIDREPNLHDLLAGRGNVENAVYDAYGIKILPSGTSLRGFLKADMTKLGRIIDWAKQNFDVVIIDTPPGLTKYSLAPMKTSDFILIVSTQDPAAVESAAKVEEIAQTMGMKINGVVINRVRKSSFFKKLHLLNRAQIQARLKSKILVGIPEDISVMEAATMRRPAVLFKPKSKVSESIRLLASKLGV
ncbi:MAG: AAA family ATPase [Candidatus Hadarchaeales archaeon]